MKGLVVLVAAAFAVIPASPASSKDASAPEFDRNANNRADFALLRPSGSAFVWFWNQYPGFQTDVFGDPTQDWPVAGDFDGDGINDVGVYRVSGNPSVWIVDLSSLACCLAVQFGDWDAFGDVPLTGDFDADGRTDFAVWRPGSPSNFHVRLASGGFQSITFGDAAEGDMPLIGDFDRDGRSDVGVRRPQTDGSTRFYFRLANGFFPTPLHFGNEDDFFAPGDYNGDGGADIAVVRAMPNGNWRWFILTTQSFTQFEFGSAAAEDRITQADYNGDGITDPSVWRPGSPGHHFVSGAGGFPVVDTPFGQTGDEPLLWFWNLCMNSQDCVD